MKSETHSIKVIAHIRSDFSDKFGIPRQSGLVNELCAKIVFEPEYRNADALRGLEQYTHIWLIWCFSESVRDEWSPTVRPPRLGGNKRMGVFATRSPFRPNPIGLSSVRLEKVVLDSAEGPILLIKGADLLDGTPVYDIKPYLPYVDAHFDATDGFAANVKEHHFTVSFPDELLALLPLDRQQAVIGVLEQDPRPGYQKNPDRIYGLDFAGFRIRFQVDGDILKVCQVYGILD